MFSVFDTLAVTSSVNSGYGRPEVVCHLLSSYEHVETVVLCSSTRLVAPTEKPLEREKRHIADCDIAELNKPARTIKHLSGPTDRIESKRGIHHLCALGTKKSWTVTQRMPRMGANAIIHETHV